MPVFENTSKELEEAKAAILDRFTKLFDKDTAGMRKMRDEILPGITSNQHMTPDQVWRMKLALSMAAMHGNSIAATKKWCAEYLQLPWVDKMTMVDRQNAVNAIKDEKARAEKKDERPTDMVPQSARAGDDPF